MYRAPQRISESKIQTPTIGGKPMFKESIIYQPTPSQSIQQTRPEPLEIPKSVFDDSSEEEIDLKYIIEEKPKTSIVRDFLRVQLSIIKNKDEEMFDCEI